MNIIGQAKHILFSTGIACSTCLPGWSQDIDHSLGPIKQAQSSDPAGFQLMIFCICLLVFMVICLFAGTIFYFVQDKKKKANRLKQGASVEEGNSADQN